MDFTRDNRQNPHDSNREKSRGNIPQTQTNRVFQRHFWWKSFSYLSITNRFFSSLPKKRLLLKEIFFRQKYKFNTHNFTYSLLASTKMSSSTNNYTWHILIFIYSLSPLVGKGWGLGDILEKPILLRHNFENKASCPKKSYYWKFQSPKI